MLEILDIGIEKAVAYRLGGKITEAEVNRVFSALEEKIARYEKILIYQEIQSLGGVEFDAILEKLKFLMEFGLSHFSRIAVVTHKEWMKRIIVLEDKLFKNIDMKAFSMEEKEQAVDFLRDVT